MRVITRDNRHDWLADRLDGIGSSPGQIGAIVGLNLQKGGWSVHREKLERIIEDDTPEMQRIRDHEPTIAKWFAREVADDWLPDGWAIEDPGDYATVWADDPPWLFCSPDRYIVHNGKTIAPLELKSTWFDHARQFEERLPDAYRAQLQITMHIHGLPRGYFGVMVNGLHLKWYVEEYHDRFCQAIINRARKFWQYIENKTPPPADFARDTSAAIAAWYDPPDDTTAELPAESLDWHNSLGSLGRKQDEIKRQQEGLKNRLKIAIGKSSAGRLPGREDGYSYAKNKAGKRSLRYARKI